MLSKLVASDFSERHINSNIAKAVQGKALKASMEEKGSYPWINDFMKEKGSLGHILGYCEVAQSEEGGKRFTWRHDSVLSKLAECTASKLTSDNG